VHKLRINGKTVQVKEGATKSEIKAALQKKFPKPVKTKTIDNTNQIVIDKIVKALATLSDSKTEIDNTEIITVLGSIHTQMTSILEELIKEPSKDLIDYHVELNRKRPNGPVIDFDFIARRQGED